jgi:hypothetical protein
MPLPPDRGADSRAAADPKGPLALAAYLAQTREAAAAADRAGDAPVVALDARSGPARGGPAVRPFPVPPA